MAIRTPPKPLSGSTPLHVELSGLQQAFLPAPNPILVEPVFFCLLGVVYPFLAFSSKVGLAKKEVQKKTRWAFRGRGTDNWEANVDHRLIWVAGSLSAEDSLGVFRAFRGLKAPSSLEGPA
jgi:hypothetical protein